MPGGEYSEHIGKFLPMMRESNGALVGRIIAIDMIKWLLLDIVHRLELGTAVDEEPRSEFAETDDELAVDSLLDWGNGILAAYSDAMVEFERNLFSGGGA